MTKEQLLFQIANTGYSTSYGRDKSYSTADLAGKTTWRVSIITLLIAMLGLLYPFINRIGLLAFGIISISIVAIYIRAYTDNRYIDSAIELQSIERELQSLYFEVKASTDSDFTQFIERLNKLDNKQKKAAINTQILGSDWYAHLKMFWAKKINSKWFVDELGLKLFFDKLPFSFFLYCLVIIILVFLTITAYFLANSLVQNGQATSIFYLIKGFCN